MTLLHKNLCVNYLGPQLFTTVYETACGIVTQGHRDETRQASIQARLKKAIQYTFILAIFINGTDTTTTQYIHREGKGANFISFQGQTIGRHQIDKYESNGDNSGYVRRRKRMLRQTTTVGLELNKCTEECSTIG